MLKRQSNIKFYSVGLSYRKANAHIRGTFSLSIEKQEQLVQDALSQGLEGVFVISTCNRTELYSFASRPCKLVELLCKYTKGTSEEFYKYANILKDQDAISHLFRMGTGIDSQILGDYEIVGQLRKSFKSAKNLGATNAYTERLVNCVLQASKRVKNETKLSSGTTSVSYAGVQYMIENLSDYNQKNILVFGLGKMGKHTCKNLAEYTQNKTISLVNRTEDKLDAFLDANPLIQKANYQELTKEISKTDVLVVSTGSSKPTILKEHIPTDKEMLILDLSVPSNVDMAVATMPNVTLVNVDELSKVTDKTLQMRLEEVPKAKLIIEEHQEEFLEWLNHRKFVPAINALKSSLQEIQQNEINFQKKKNENFNEEQAEAITSRIIQKITTQFVKHLKNDTDAINQSIEVMSKVFEMSFKAQ